MLTFITTPTDLIGQISPVATGLIGDFAPFAALIIGIAIGLWLLRWGIDTIIGIKDRRTFRGGGYESDPLLTEADKAYYRKKYAGVDDDDIF
jgi:hypothetical protein